VQIKSKLKFKLYSSGLITDYSVIIEL